jgi:nitroreductase
MELTDAIRRRRMIRNYDPERAVPRSVLDDLLSLAVCAPSAGYSQGWSFLILDDITSCQAFWSATTDETEEPDAWLMRMQNAPALIVCLSDKQAYLDRYAEPDKGWTDRDESHWPVPYWDIDTGMAALLILLGAVEQGLGACFFGIPGEHWPAFRTRFEVPERLTPVGVISLGYPAPDVRSPSLARGRRSPAEVVHYGSFGRTPESPAG